VHPVFRKKTHGQIIGEELQEGFSHIGTAVAEARRAAAEQLAPRVEAAREATGPALEAAKVAVVPKVAAAVAVAAPAVANAREALAPRYEAARDALGPRYEAALDAIAPRVEAAREAAGPHLAAAVTAAQHAATKAAADLAPRVEAAREAAHKTLEKDVVPRLTAAQAATLAYAAPRVLAAREAVTPVLESTRESLVTGLHDVLEEIDVRRDELTATTKKAKKQAARKRKELTRKAAKKAGKAGKKARRAVGVEPSPRRWPWLLAVLGLAAAAVVVLRRRKDDDLWTPAPAGDGPVPSYREDPVPSSPSNTGKTVSDATTAPGDSTPPETDLGMQPQQLAEGSAGPVEDTPLSPAAEGGDEERRGDAPEPFSSEGPGDAGPTAGPDDRLR
jgi:hypothetical protein